jgi:glutamate/tyrosine decarboxylase-like PLP-dependent enzyme
MRHRRTVNHSRRLQPTSNPSSCQVRRRGRDCAATTPDAHPRHHSLAAPKVYGVLPCNQHVRKHARRALLFERQQPGLQCEWRVSPRNFLLRAGQWICSPACTELEQVMMDWMAKMLGLSDEYLTISGVGGGIILVSTPNPDA